MAYWGEYFPPSRPRQAKGGIRAQSQRGSFGESWWAKRWIAVLDGFHLGARMSRGRSYARSGQVLAIEIKAGKVEARVQGSRPQPYRVTIEVNPIKQSTWEDVAAKTASEARFASKLLAGEMPGELEQIFADLKAPLFPAKYSDLKTACSCPDWENPCKHTGAVYYLLAEEFDRDPFLIFRLRGMEREKFLAMLGSRAANVEASAERPEPEPEPLPMDPALFWRAAEIPADLLGPDLAAEQATQARRLGGFPFWRGEHPLLEFLDETQKRAAASAALILGGGPA